MTLLTTVRTSVTSGWRSVLGQFGVVSLDDLRHAGLPARGHALDASWLAGLDPAQNVRLLGEEVDLDLEEFGLVLEVDGGVHDNPLAQLDDARKQARLERKGVHVTRVGRR